MTAFRVTDFYSITIKNLQAGVSDANPWRDGSEECHMARPVRRFHGADVVAGEYPHPVRVRGRDTRSGVSHNPTSAIPTRPSDIHRWRAPPDGPHESPRR